MDKKNLNFVLGEKLATCPFNPSHRVPVSRLPAHNVACKKNHPDMEMKTCPFCATHLIPKPLFQAHLLECPQKAIVERDLYQRKEMERLPGNPQPVVQAPQEHQQPYQFEDEEDWDSEMVESSYNPEAAMAYKEFTRPPPPGCLAKSKRKEWRAKEVERVEKLRNGEAYVLDEPDTVMAQNFAGKAKPSNDLMTSTHPLRRPSAASLALSSKMMGQLSISDDKRRLAQNPSSEKWNGAEKGGLEKPNFGFVVEEGIDEATKAFIKEKRKLEKKLDQIIKLEEQSISRQLNMQEKEKVASKEDVMEKLEDLYTKFKVVGIDVL